MEDSKIEEIKAKTDIVELISSYVALTKAGKNYKGLCPFHNEATPSFMVSPELQIFKCFGCGKGGNCFSFVMELESVEFPAALKILGDRAGVKVEVRENPDKKDRRETILEINHLAAEYYHFLLTKHKVGETGLGYLKNKRGLTDETIKNFKLGYAPESWRSLGEYLLSKKYRLEDIIAAGLAIPNEGREGYYDRFRGRIVFPINDQAGNVVGFTARTLTNEEPKYLNVPETEVFHKGKVLYGIDKAKIAIKRNGLAVIVEGQMDVISSHQASFSNVVASSGTALTLEHLTLLKKLAPDLAFCFDTDAAGVEASKRGIELAEQLGLNLKIIVVPKPYKDLDECVRSDPSAFKQAMENSISIYDFYFVTAFGKYSTSDALGKKKIAETLAPVIRGIKNPVQKDLYLTKLAEGLGVSSEAVRSMVGVSNPEAARAINRVSVEKELKSLQLKDISLQEHMLSLILKAPLDLSQTNLYKLGQRDFTDPDLEKIFVELKDYLLGRKRKLEIKYFCAKLEAALAERVQSLYLRDFDNLEENEESAGKELAATLKRIKVETAKRELKTLANKITEAEARGDHDEVIRLSEEFNNISGRLI